ncbi:MAG: hypothetical protein M1834_009232 [Cirrosporium novae-zelandiae]|nr:MAG: hypothetical protein M1834_009232 [Cirrosporium novae-zelandiae]
MDISTLKKGARVEQVDILIVGPGPIGATFALLMVDVGEQAIRRVGGHKKNSVSAQKDISLFTNTVKGELHPLSVPTNTTYGYLEPSSWDPTPSELLCLQNGQNPEQSPWDNIPSASASRVVGGMGSHWTCCTPRQHELERSNLFTNQEWKELYSKVEELFRTNSTSFDDSIRQQLVKHVLQDAYKDTGRKIISMPLACKRSERNKDYVEWTCTATILGDLWEPSYSGGLFEIRPNNQCIKLQLDDETGQIAWALVKDLLKDEKYYIMAKKYVVCTGAILTPGVLFNSGFTAQTLPALGHYMTEQTMAFCQVVLKRSLVDNIKNDPYNLGWIKKVKEHKEKAPNDPLPFPFNDPDPQCYFPLSESHPWHTQIHRDAFGYGEVPPTID